jgi:hypothetical protein
MNTFGKFLGCCNIYNKTFKMSDIEIKKVKNENENLTYLYSEKNTQMNRNLNTSNNINQPINLTYNTLNINIIDRSNSKNDEEEKRSGSFSKNIQNIIHKRTIQNDNSNENFAKQNNALTVKKTLLSLSDMSFVSENNEHQKSENFSKLLLTGDLFFGREIIITDTGMVNSKRNKKDGFTVFGLKNSVDISGQLNNDFIINFNKQSEDYENMNADTESGKVFQIIFNKKSKDYILYFLNPYLYLYYKINNYVYFYPQRDYFIFVGKIFFSIDVQKEGNEQIINIQVDTYDNNANKNEINKKYSFNQNKFIIKIGRVNCDINIPEKCISKLHGIIEFSKSNQKFYYKDMNSTNGTTLLIKKDDSLRIRGEMNFKLDDVTFKIQEIP